MKLQLLSLALALCLCICVAKKPQLNTTAISTCQLLTNNDLTQLSGWQKLQDTVTNDLGGGWDGFHVNWDQMPNSKAYVCSNGAATYWGIPQLASCNDATTMLQGQLNTDGTVTVSVASGFSTSETATVTSSATIGVGVEIAAEANLEIAKLSTKVSTSFTIANTMGQSTTNSIDSTITNSVTIRPAAGQKCSISLAVETCNYRVQGTVPISASGWVWFNYPSRRNGHYYWAYQLEGILSEEERSQYVQLNVAMKTTSYGNYNSVCTSGAALEDGASVASNSRVSPHVLSRLRDDVGLPVGTAIINGRVVLFADPE